MFDHWGAPKAFRGLQLGEEQAPLISPPDSRRPETAYASYSLHSFNAGREFLQIPSRQILHKCLSHRSKQATLFFGTVPLDRPICSVDNPPSRPPAVNSVNPIRSWPAETGTGDLGVSAGPEFLELCVRCGGFG